MAASTFTYGICPIDVRARAAASSGWDPPCLTPLTLYLLRTAATSTMSCWVCSPCWSITGGVAPVRSGPPAGCSARTGTTAVSRPALATANAGTISGTLARSGSGPHKLSKKFPRAGVAKLADAQDLKSWDPQGSCGFDPRPRHSNSLSRVVAPWASAGHSTIAAARLGLRERPPSPAPTQSMNCRQSSRHAPFARRSTRCVRGNR